MLERAHYYLSCRPPRDGDWAEKPATTYGWKSHKSDSKISRNPRVSPVQLGLGHATEPVVPTATAQLHPSGSHFILSDSSIHPFFITYLSHLAGVDDPAEERLAGVAAHAAVVEVGDGQVPAHRAVNGWPFFVS